MRMIARSALLAAVVSTFGCDEPVADATATDATTKTDAVSCDPSSCPPPTAAQSRVAPPEPFGMRIGTNEPGKTNIEAFTEAEAESVIPVVLGGQGAWMVVVAAVTDSFSCCVDRINVKAKLASPDGTTLFGQLAFKRRPVFRGPDDAQYILNIWLVIGDPAVWDNQKAVLDVELEPYGGGEIVKRTVPVTLRRSTVAAVP